MKAVVLCLFALALVSNAEQANFAGKWYSPLGSPNYCAPVGPITITQAADGKTNIQFKTDPLSITCKALELAGQAITIEDGVLAESTLSFNLKSKNGTTMPIVLSKDGTKFEIDFTYPLLGKKSASEGQKLELLSLTDDLATKMKSYEGTYSFKLTAGTADQCCLPESITYGETEANIFYTTGKFGTSNACNAQGLSNVNFGQNPAVGSANGFQWELKSTNDKVGYMTLVVGSDPQNAAAGLKFGTAAFGSGNADTCQITATKTAGAPDAKKPIFKQWWFWLVLILVVAVIIAAGYFFYRHRKAQQLKSTLLYSNSYSA